MVIYFYPLASNAQTTKRRLVQVLNGFWSIIYIQFFYQQPFRSSLRWGLQNHHHIYCGSHTSKCWQDAKVEFLGAILPRTQQTKAEHPVHQRAFLCRRHRGSKLFQWAFSLAHFKLLQSSCKCESKNSNSIPNQSSLHQKQRSCATSLLFQRKRPMKQMNKKGFLISHQKITKHQNISKPITLQTPNPCKIINQKYPKMKALHVFSPFPRESSWADFGNRLNERPKRRGLRYSFGEGKRRLKNQSKTLWKGWSLGSWCEPLFSNGFLSQFMLHGLVHNPAIRASGKKTLMTCPPTSPCQSLLAAKGTCWEGSPSSEPFGISYCPAKLSGWLLNTATHLHHAAPM